MARVTGTKNLHPRLWAVLDDACLMIFRIFGVNARPHLPGLDPLDRPWIFHEPWVCRYIHTEEAFHPTGPSLHHPPINSSRFQCAIARQQTGLPKRGTCLSGLVYRTIPLNLGRGFSGTLVLGPFMPSTPTDQGFTRLCRHLGTPEWDHMRWAWRESPVLGPPREKELVAFSRNLFGKIGARFSPLASGKTWEDVSGVSIENIYPPIRLADDYPLRIFGVFVTYSTGLQTPGKLLPKPFPTCDLEYIDKGRCRISAQGDNHTLEQGQAMLFLPGDNPEMRLIEGHPCENISISFVANASLLRDLAGKPFSLDAFQHSLLSRLSRLAGPGDDSSHRNSEVKILLTQLLMSARLRPTAASPSPVSPPATPAYRRSRHEAAIIEARNILDGAAERRISLKELARHVNLGIPTLIRLFRMETGLTPIRYHFEKRIEHAQLLLRHSLLTVTQIAEKLGFQSVHHFSGSFKRKTGKTPTEYARSLKSAMRQIEEAEKLLREGRLSVSQIAEQLGFPSVFSFAQTFKRYTGNAPDKYAHGKMG